MYVKQVYLAVNLGNEKIGISINNCLDRYNIIADSKQMKISEKTDGNDVIYNNREYYHSSNHEYLFSTPQKYIFG